MQSSAVPLETAAGPQCRAGVSGGKAPLPGVRPGPAAPRSARSGAFVFPGRPGRPASAERMRDFREVQTCSKGSRRPKSMR